MAELVVGVTGASGTLFAREFIRCVLTVPQVNRLHVIVSRFALQTLRAELGQAGTTEEGARRELAGDPSPLGAGIPLRTRQCRGRDHEGRLVRRRRVPRGDASPLVDRPATRCTPGVLAPLAPSSHLPTSYRNSSW